MIKVEQFAGKHWSCITKYVEVTLQKQRQGMYGPTMTDFYYIPEWDQMKDYPDVAIQAFKKQTVTKTIEGEHFEGVLTNYSSFYETAVSRLNFFLAKVNLNKSELISVTYIPSTEQSAEHYVLVYES